MSNNKSQVVLITGASSGIGEALSKYYASPDIILGLVARNAAELHAVAEACRLLGARVYEYVVDVCDVKNMRKCAADFLEQTGKVDIVIANAGIRREEDDDCQQWDIPEETMRVNYLGVINTFSPFIRPMKERRAGQFVVISSIGAYRGTPNSGAYSASKAAINVWSESLRLRLIPYKISVSTICMGFVATAMTEGLPFSMPGILSAAEAANLIANAIKARKRVVTLPWQSRYIWTVFRVLPGVLYDKLILWAKSRHPKREE